MRIFRNLQVGAMQQFASLLKQGTKSKWGSSFKTSALRLISAGFSARIMPPFFPLIVLIIPNLDKLWIIFIR